MNLRFFLPIGLFFSLGVLHAQNPINQFDKEGKRHGLWKKFYTGTKQIRYEGTFEHGREVGVFKFYCGECDTQPTAVRTFNEKDASVWVQYFTKEGHLVSEGKMVNQLRVGEWVYFHEKSKQVMTREYYEGGELQGLQTTYYPDGKITEEVHYKNGIKEGENLYYSPEGIVIKRLQYRNDQLQGPAFYYDASGNLVIEGFYKDDKKHGLWKYYKNGALELEETYPKTVNRQ
ncbi:MAG TPA: hypothetical protein PKW08_00935 [Flavobacteriaceae bacterium]|nr:toxin-antitoxin system YwqK family antitoxin [Flavobacteriaceae bacterium]MCB9212376.1 toxin-antitoxin system YwqK family antitoxin [Alteromonas sp.]HPF11652.1 hypothetical protein [Flavobacteriaceae bacterium]HQU20127.1 hypothetical protein [Flavobacteriaceae bacterium]HQU64784.1 hypothetical protein [Flavobacteriaceae bacterium]